jgi:hypothetical protein
VTNDEAVTAVFDALTALGVDYMVTGSLASNLYGVPRSTKDADLVIYPDAPKLAGLSDVLQAPLNLDPQMSFETVTATTRLIIRWAKRPFKIELFLLSNDPHDQERFRRRQRGMMLGRMVCVPTPEDVIITKLRWSQAGKRSKDVDDVRNVIAVQGDRIDWGYVHRWCDEHGTRDLLEKIRQSIPPKVH